MKVLVTGANGFIGSAVAERLNSKNIDVVGLVRTFDGEEKGIRLIKADVCRKSAFEEIETDFDAVVHCAGLAHQPFGTPKGEFSAVNVKGTHNTARFAADNNIKRFIHISSVSVYGDISYEGLIDESADCVPVGPYAESKLESENVCRSVFEGRSTKLMILRPATVIGEGDRGNVGKLIRFLDSGLFVKVGKGRNLKSFVYVKDVAGAVAAILACPSPDYEVYNVTAGPISIDETINILSEALDRKRPWLRIPSWAVRLPLKTLRTFGFSGRIEAIDEALRKFTSEDAFDGTRLHDIFRPAFSAPEALKREAEWYKKSK